MRTRLTDVLQIEHPVMLAGMGGVSYSPPRRGRERGRRHRHHGRGARCRRTADDRRDRQGPRRSPTSRSASTCSPRCPDTLPGPGPGHHRRRGHDVRGRPRRAARRRGAVPPEQRARRLDVRQGPPRHRLGRGRVRHRDRPGHRGRRPHRARSPPSPSCPQCVDAVGDRVPVVAAGGIVDGRGLAAALALGADGIWVGTALHRHPRGPHRQRLQGEAARAPRGRHRRHRRRTPARPAGSWRTATPARSPRPAACPSRSRCRS